MVTPRSLYDVLNVSPDAEGVVIEAAYRALMKKYHPDQAAADGAGGGSNASEINQAFAVLRDPTRRADYDRREWSRHQAFHLAESQAMPPPRRGGAFGWAGWFVAVLLGAILFTFVNGRGGLILPPAGGGNEAAPSASSQPDQRSQPEKIEPSDRAGPTRLDREIATRDAAEAAARRNAAAAEEAIADAPPPILADEPRPDFSLRARSLPARAHYRKPRRRPGARTTKARDEDFLRREGYIY
jgi:curved DNA-binding protein CbpA